MVTSTSTPGSILMEVIYLTISEGLCRSMSHLWILIWKQSQVLEPSPQVFLVVILSLGRHPNRSFRFEILFLRASDQVSTYPLQRLQAAAGEGDSNPVNRRLGLSGIFKSHSCGPTCSSARANSGESGAGAGGPRLRCSGDRVFLQESHGTVLFFICQLF